MDHPEQEEAQRRQEVQQERLREVRTQEPRQEAARYELFYAQPVDCGRAKALPGVICDIRDTSTAPARARAISGPIEVPTTRRIGLDAAVWQRGRRRQGGEDGHSLELPMLKEAGAA
jgi:hypothetical protein